MLLYLILFVLLLASELFFFKLADYFNIIDKPNHRSSHTKVTIRGGGLIFYVGVMLYFLVFGFEYPWFFAGLTLIAGISFVDDVKPSPSWLRLIVQFVAMGLMFNQWGLYELPWFFTVLALVFCTGVLNAYNFMDGINGITGGYSFIVVASLWYINTFQHTFVDNNLIYTLLLAILVFNFFNFRKKAKCFAGDVGAIAMAFILVFLLGQLMLKTQDFSYIMLLAVYGVDTILTIIHRLKLRENIFEAHRKHLFQIMANELKMPHLVVSSIYMLVQGIIAVGLVLSPNRLLYSILILSILSAVYLLFMRKYFKLHLVK